MTSNIIATGSTGNAVLINDSILVDIGVPYAKLAPHAGEIKLVLLTHQHGDHFHAPTVKRLHALRPALRFGCGPWMVPPLLEAGVDARAIDVYDMGKEYHYPAFGFSVMAQEIPHNVPNCCYHITRMSDGEKLFYATDTGSLDEIEAKGYGTYCVESNWVAAEMMERIEAKISEGKYAYEMQAMQNHLSDVAVRDWLSRNASEGSEIIYLHQHKD